MDRYTRFGFNTKLWFLRIVFRTNIKTSNTSYHRIGTYKLLQKKVVFIKKNHDRLALRFDEILKRIVGPFEERCLEGFSSVELASVVMVIDGKSWSEKRGWSHWAMYCYDTKLKKWDVHKRKEIRVLILLLKAKTYNFIITVILIYAFYKRLIRLNNNWPVMDKMCAHTRAHRCTDNYCCTHHLTIIGIKKFSGIQA